MTVFFRPCGDITKAPTPRGENDTALYNDLMAATGLTIEIDPSVDYEDWMEPACVLDQAIQSGLETHILPATQLRRAVMNPIVKIAGETCRDILVGRQLKSDPQELQYFDLGWPAACDTMANHYAELETFHRHAGRKLALANMPGDPEGCGDRTVVFGEGLNSTALGDAMASVSPGAVIVKQVYPGKSLPLLTYDLDEAFKPADGDGLFFEDIGFHFARFEGDPAALLVQEKITMTHETRFFVIGGKVISGAACIENHTPQQTPYHDDVLPPHWEITRNSGEMDTREHMDRKRTALAMWNFVHDVCTEIAEEAPELHSYVIDVALGADGKPLVIELNPVASSGIYANNIGYIFDAIVEYAKVAPARKVASWNPCAFVGYEPKPSAPTLDEMDTVFDDEDDDEWTGDAIEFVDGAFYDQDPEEPDLMDPALLEELDAPQTPDAE
jgi:hypothetical protein